MASTNTHRTLLPSVPLNTLPLFCGRPPVCRFSALLDPSGSWASLVSCAVSLAVKPILGFATCKYSSFGLRWYFRFYFFFFSFFVFSYVGDFCFDVSCSVFPMFAAAMASMIFFWACICTGKRVDLFLFFVCIFCRISFASTIDTNLSTIMRMI